MGKKKVKRSASEWQQPAEKERDTDTEQLFAWSARSQHPAPPRRGLIAGFIGFTVLMAMGFLIFWLPSNQVVNDLRDRGVEVSGEVVAATDSLLKVRYPGPDGAVTAELQGWGGTQPDASPGDAMGVTYDSKEPTRALNTNWVHDPPAFTLPMLFTLALTPFFLAGTIVLILRRRRILREFGPMIERPAGAGVQLDK